MTSLRNAFFALLLTVLTLTVVNISHAQTLSTADEFFGQASLQQNSAASDALTQETEFLPVEQAYQLSITLNGEQSDTLTLRWNIADGYYLYRHMFDATLNGEKLSLSLPTGKTKYDEYFEKDLEVYYGAVEIEAQLPKTVAEDASTLRVRSQGCADAGLCYPPHTEQFNVTAKSINQLEAAPLPGSEPLAATAVVNSSLASYFLAIMGALLGGLILNLMPCVFPVLSLKALSLAGSSQSEHSKHVHGWVYTLGAATMFVVVAAIMLALRQAGQAVGWGFQLQSPLVIALLVYLFFSMGLFLSGQFSSRLSTMSNLGNSLTQGNNLRSSFFTGVLATVVASPCTAPFMGSALGYAITQPAPLALGIFAALGIGMGLPFLLLSYYPALNRILPKPGPWMERLKQLLAFPLYLTALWLLWVLGRQAGSDAIVWTLAGAVSIAFALWILQSTPLRSWQKALALAAMLAATLPLKSLQQGVLGYQPEPQALSNGWQPFTQQRLAQLRDSGTPVLVNLTADWCITCLANEKVALDRPATLDALDRAGVVKLKGDWTRYDPEITRVLNQYGRSGVPLYLLFSNNGGSKPLILPQLLTENLVITAVEGLNTADNAKLTAN